ncbi:ankyrin, partial [Cadophora sp. DSE1049]
LVTLLLANGANINGQGGDTGNTLQAAVIQGDEEVVELLLKSGADINGGGGEYESPLITAVTCRDKSMMKLLLDNGADINMQFGGRDTALMAAVWNNDEEAVAFLLRNGADPCLYGGDFGSAWQLATSKSYAKILELLGSITRFKPKRSESGGYEHHTDFPYQVTTIF